MRNEANYSCEQSERLGRIGHRPESLRSLSLLARTAHQVGAAVFLAVFLLDGGVSPPRFYVLLALASGLVLLVTECWRHRQFHREAVGVTMFGKLVILGAAWHALLAPRPFVLLSFLLASIVAHLPKAMRHRLIY